MPIPLAVPFIAAGAQLLGGALGKIFGDADRADQERWLQMAMDEYGKIDLPKLQQIVAEQQGPSAFSSIRTDPRLRDAQFNALDKLQQIEEGGGRSLEMEVAERKALNEAAQKGAGARAAIMDSMRARGAGGSGAELAAMLDAESQGANRMADVGMDSAARAQAAYFDAIMGRGQMAGQMRGQEFNEDSQKAQATDLINRYNTGLRAQAQVYNANLPNQHYQNQLLMADRKSRGYRDMAGLSGERAQDTQRMWGGLGNAAGTGISAVGSYMSQPQTQTPSPVRAWSGDWRDEMKKTKPSLYGAGDYYLDEDDERYA